MTLKYTYLLLMLSLIACNADKTTETAQNIEITEEVKALEGYTKISIPLLNGEGDIYIPGNKLTSATPELFKNNAGVTHLKLGENFHLEIIEQETNIAMLVNDLSKDIFYKSKIISKTETEIIYEKGLPDGSASFFHFCKLLSADDQLITVKSASNGQFRKSHVDRMLKSANSFTSSSNQHLLSSTPK